jgi:hypothetical protein
MRTALALAVAFVLSSTAPAMANPFPWCFDENDKAQPHLERDPLIFIIQHVNFAGHENLNTDTNSGIGPFCSLEACEQARVRRGLDVTRGNNRASMTTTCE